MSKAQAERDEIRRLSGRRVLTAEEVAMRQRMRARYQHQSSRDTSPNPFWRSFLCLVVCVALTMAVAFIAATGAASGDGSAVVSIGLVALMIAVLFYIPLFLIGAFLNFEEEDGFYVHIWIAVGVCVLSFWVIPFIASLFT